MLAESAADSPDFCKSNEAEVQMKRALGVTLGVLAGSFLVAFAVPTGANVPFIAWM